ncbi:hypothetical protein [Bacillus swezeyi]|uniref:Uncharacterized protein n=1 Tax=Bacillus swezeyi TaxID=1925020 RepID=A0A5M8RJ85_9BACI|nr:hypothetical protein [Bacillus swezeyi]KAA6446926.1 hypothetical protein DX927_23015 [Bacillus swezeyi]KAA6471494.1 hypothetical protein DX928_23255 [Bacillus swezeyi]
MELSTFSWSVLASLVATALIGGASVIYKKKSKGTIKQKGDGNTAYMNSIVYNERKEDKKGE